MLVIFMIAMMDYTEQKAGLAIAVVPAAVLVLTPVAGWLTDRIGPRVPAVTGALVAAAGLVALGVPGPLRPARVGAVAERARRRRHRPLAAGAARRRHERRARRRQGRRLRHAQHGAPARLPARRRHPRRRVRAHHERRRQHRRRQGSGAGPRRRRAERAGPRQARRRARRGAHHRRHRRHRRDPPHRPPHRRGHRAGRRLLRGHRAAASSRTCSRTCSGTRSRPRSAGRSSWRRSPRPWAPWRAPSCRGASARTDLAAGPPQRPGAGVDLPRPPLPASSAGLLRRTHHVGPAPSVAGPHFAGQGGHTAARTEGDDQRAGSRSPSSGACGHISPRRVVARQSGVRAACSRPAAT